MKWISTMKNKTAQKETGNLILYFVLAYAISWAIAVPLALEKTGLMNPVLPFSAHYFVAYGPLLSAMIVTWLDQGGPGIKELGKRMITWSVRPIWWIAALSPLILGFVVILVLNLSTGNGSSLSSLGEVNFLPPLGMGALALWLLTFGIGEETGWRGYALAHWSQVKVSLFLSR